jgi:phospholipid/cholesterol/gamma-HCH transport system permease protein
VRKLVVPRFLGCLLSLPLLTVIADAVALMGGYVIVGSATDLYAGFYWRSTVEFLQLSDLVMGVVKPLCFGLVIASVSCHVGLSASGGAEQVGLAAKRSVVAASILILINDFFLTKIFLVIFQ